MPEAATVRRRPVQQRSIARVERILEACAQLLDDVGYDALTTREVAARAGVPIGTLYQFFTGKPELCSALARRNLDQFTRRLRARFEAEPVSHWQDAATAVIEEFVAMKRSTPGFAVVDFGDVRPGRPFLLDEGEAVENNDFVARRLAALGVDELGLPAADHLDEVLLVAVEAVDGTMRLAFRRDPDGDETLIAEAETLLRGYLAARLG
jgi:AcrR family transcriptional regulator